MSLMRKKNEKQRKGRMLWKFSTQLRLSYFVAIFLPLLIIGSLFITYTSRQQENHDKNMLETYNKGMSQALYEIFTQIQSISDTIVYNDELIDFLNGDYESDTEMRVAASKVELVDRYTLKYSGVDEIAIYVDRPDMINYGQFHAVDASVRDSSWYQTAMSQYRISWFSSFFKNQYNKDAWGLTLVRRMVLVGGERSAVIMIRVSNAYLASHFQNDNYISLISINNQPAAYSSSTLYYGQQPEVDIDYEANYYQFIGSSILSGKKVLTAVNSIETAKTSDTFYLITYNLNAYNSLRKNLVISILIFLAALLIPFGFIYLSSKRFANQVGELRYEMGKASKGQYDKMKKELTTSVELHDAFEDLLTMVSNIQKMQADQYEKVLLEQNMEIREKKLQNEQQRMEFRMLANQINPHFLYNTLESIRMKAIAAGDKEVANGIKLLGKSMRYVLDTSGTADTNLQKEIDYIIIYLQIQQLRFGDRVNYDIKIKEGLDTTSVEMIPLLIQPIVENSIIHGLEAKTENGHLQINIEEDNNEILISVTDNGGGITEDKLKEIQEKLKNDGKDIPTQSIGFYNINRRIKLKYGEEYGLNISSIPDEGTTVSIHFPYVNKLKRRTESDCN